MCVKLLGLLLFACQIILNGSYEIHPVTDYISQISVTPTPAPLPDGYVTFPELHSAYKIYSEVETWDDARDRCVSDGARLAIADSVDKIRRINGIKTRNHNRIHVGIRKSITTNQWVTIDNSLPVSSTLWLEGNPDEFGDCAGIPASFGDTLVNYPCEYEDEWFVCEIPM